MAVLFMDGCDNYAATADLTKKWTSNTNQSAVTFNPTAGRFGGGCIHFVANTGYLTKSIPNSSTFVMGCWHKIGTAGAMQSDNLFKLKQSGAGAAHGVIVKIEADGAIALYMSDDPVAKAVSSNKLIANIGYSIQMKAVCANGANGSIEVRVGNVTWVSWTGDTYVSNTGGTWGTFELHGQGLANSYVDDVWLLNNTGTVNTNWLGDMRIQTNSLDGDAAITQDWTPLTGPGLYTEVNETNSGDDDASYISTATVGHKSRFTVSDMTAVPAYVAAVQVTSRAKKTDAGARSFRVYVNSSGTEQAGATQALQTDYLSHQDMFEVNPNTGAAWTQSAIDALEIGVELVG